MPLTVGNVEIHMGPKEAGGPDDLKKPIIDFIDGAKKRLFIAVQELESVDITKAIVRARQRKVLVKLVLEGSYLRVDKAVPDPFQPGGQKETNRELQNAVLRANIDVKTDFNPKIFHQKFMVRDSSAVLTGSTNFTDTGVTNNLNHIVIVHDRKIANTYRKEFDEIQKGRFGTQSAAHGETPREVEVSKIPVKILFAPDHAPEMEIMKQMLKASSSIDFAIFTFSKSSGIDDTMIALTQKNPPLPIRGILDKRQANQKWAATRPVKNAGATLRQLVPKGKLRKLHHKLMVIDKQVVIAGSFNYTGPANRLNDENIIVLGNLETTAASSINAQKKVAGYALKEIDRIFKDQAVPID